MIGHTLGYALFICRKEQLKKVIKRPILWVIHKFA